MVIKHTLAYVGLPVITPLSINLFVWFPGFSTYSYGATLAASKPPSNWTTHGQPNGDGGTFSRYTQKSVRSKGGCLVQVTMGCVISRGRGHSHPMTKARFDLYHAIHWECKVYGPAGLSSKLYLGNGNRNRSPRICQPPRQDMFPLGFRRSPHLRKSWPG